jgi:hypothetical protein
MRRITRDLADSIYTIFVTHLAAHEGMDGDERGRFIDRVTMLAKPQPLARYRLTGLLGPNGEFVNDGSRQDVPHVSCPDAELTPDREAMIGIVNAELLSLFGAVQRRMFGGR